MSRVEPLASAAILRLLVHALREHWPSVQIVLRADAGFGTPRVFHACQRLGIRYILDFATNDRLKRISAPLLDAAEREYRAWGRPVRLNLSSHYPHRQLLALAIHELRLG